MPYDYPQRRIVKEIQIDAITSIHYFEFTDSFEDQPEDHEPWELIYIDRGSCGIVADGEYTLLSQGDMYFHKPNETHMLKTVKGTAPNIFIITFLSSSPAMRYFEDKKLSASMSAKQHISAILHEASETFDIPLNNPKMQLLEPRRAGALWGGEQSILIRLELMLIEIIRENRYYTARPRSYFSTEPITDEFALSVIAHLEEHLYGRISMDELSRALSFSKAYISKTFGRVSGYSVGEYFTKMKIAEAKRLIRESNHNFYEISEMLMFSNSHYFSNVFRKYTGMTPSQYKKSCKID